MEAGRCVWSRLGERGETRCQPAEQEQDLLKDEHPRAEARTMVGSKSGSTPGPEILCPASSARGGVGASSRPRDSRPARAAIGHARYRGQRGMGFSSSYFREAPHGVMQTLGQPPRPLAAQHALICGRGAARMQTAQDDCKSGREPCSVVASPAHSRFLRLRLRLRCTSAYVGRCAQWAPQRASAADGLLPRHGPPATPTIAGPCFLQDSMHGDSYPCCRAINSSWLTCIFV
jgi:hypothetical protein